MVDMKIDTENAGVSRHSSCMGLFVAVTVVLMVFGTVILQPYHWVIGGGGWITLLGFMVSGLCFLGMFVFQIQSHVVALMLGVISAAALVPMMLQAVARL